MPSDKTTSLPLPLSGNSNKNPLLTDPLELQFQHYVKPGRPFFDFAPPQEEPQQKRHRFFGRRRPKKAATNTTMPIRGRRGRSPAPPAPAKTSSPPPPTTPSANGYSHDSIVFPKVYEDAWGLADVARSDLERARIFLLRFTNMSADPLINAGVRAIVADTQRNTTVLGIALAIQHSIFGNRHAEFSVTPLLQATRFMLIKARIPEKLFAEHAQSLIDFFFDPTLQRNLSPPPPGETVVYRYPAGRLRVCIVGGGPTGLASAISLAEKGAGNIEVHVWERRWVLTEDGRIDYPPTARRRDQVVTLQDTVTNLLTKESYQALFAGRPERVWPGSANIQIRKVEDRFLKRCQDPEFRGLIYLHAEGVTRDELAAGKCGDFHVLLGTDGAASWVRGSYFRGYEKERGRSYALGLAFDRGAKGGLPWSQPLNMFLTLGQTRYLLNASDHDGRGYLNMQVTEEEWDKMVAADGQPVHFGRPGCLRRADGSIPDGFDESRVFKPSQERESATWKSIEDGLKLFGFKESEVINVVRIPIVVQAVREGVRQLPLEDSRFVKRPHALVAVAGDAAMTVHFWPGRGLNSGIKAGIALGDEIMHALNGGRFVGLELGAMKEYNDFIMKLQGREHDKRSIPILNQSGSPEMLGWLLSKAASVPDTVALEWLVGAMTQIADRLERRDDWHFSPEANIEPQIRIVLRQMHSLTLREMAVSFPWPTREMAGAEVLPIRSMKPEEKQKWLQQLWGLLSVEKLKEASAARAKSPGPPSTASTARFEAPRAPRGARSPSPNPMARLTLNDRQGSPPPQSNGNGNLLDPSPSLRRSNAAKNSVRRYSNAQALPLPQGINGNGNGYNGSDNAAGSRPQSPGISTSMTPPNVNGMDGGLTRLLSVKKPTGSVLSDAMALALFRVGED
ncbi:hypothetical protein B0H66DRAFT_637957 [Apodospora peruviana]|uniref:Uncharacterized protein n=1 Tax=Apodospora peruviana TaxID=516989 RepID=A0AAE0IKA4_9PEZI|nr:hypothetical protein B0H66DRAFT_637957 [Apodospora peruviana]